MLSLGVAGGGVLCCSEACLHLSALLGLALLTTTPVMQVAAAGPLSLCRSVTSTSQGAAAAAAHGG